MGVVFTKLEAVNENLYGRTSRHAGLVCVTDLYRQSRFGDRQLRSPGMQQRVFFNLIGHRVSDFCVTSTTS
jgi:hypothetical protein